MIFCKERFPQWFNKDYGIPLSQLREKDLAVGSVSLQEIATSSIAFTVVHILSCTETVLRPLERFRMCCVFPSFPVSTGL
jgi:hypothetical protein